MKNSLTGLVVLSSLMLSMTPAHAAAPTAELKVIGTLTVPSCTIVAPDDGVYDLGKLSSSLVKAGTTATGLTAMTKTWTVTCDADTYLNFTPVDNRAASASVAGTSYFGMGNVNDTGKIGYYTAVIRNATVDGKATNIFSSTSGAFTAYSARTLVKGERAGWASADNTQSVGKVFVADIAVTPVLAGTTTMNGPITDDAKIDGSMTMNFAFGI